MKFIYGKQDFNTLERGQENCYLLTNGLGGFSSATMVNSVTRNDHALFMACVQAPNHRYNMVHRLSESLEIGANISVLSSQQFENGEPEEGFRHQTGFSFEDVPVWTYQVEGVDIQKTVAMEQGHNRVAVLYEMENRGRKSARFTVTPWFQFVRKGSDIKEKQRFLRTENKVTSEDMKLFFYTGGTVQDIPDRYETYYYAYDACDGRRSRGSACANHQIVAEIPAGGAERLELVYSMEADEIPAARILEDAIAYRNDLKTRAGFASPVADMLAKSANQFISERRSTGGKTILAGYPFFEDWGRDTMIALPGCTLATGQFDTARSILRTFMANEKDGLMPNLFPEGGNEPAYNTVDAALLYINCVYLYYKKTGDLDFVKETYETMEHIISCYKEGTHYGIFMDRDGLIQAGQDLDQVTWMDVRVGEILPTPRHGKPVEINAYWYNALKIMAEFCGLLKREDTYSVLSGQVKTSFVNAFWDEELQCLKDVISGTKSDRQIRCNQIWAISMPFTMLSSEQERAVVETVYETLYTPYGLRTLNREDTEFEGFYGGQQLDRDLAYHQGTVWAFPLGAYYRSYLKVNHYNSGAIQKVLKQLELLECAMREGCIGQLPEIYDGENPSNSKGCFAQAWSVGELLSVYEEIERIRSVSR